MSKQPNPGYQNYREKKIKQQKKSIYSHEMGTAENTMAPRKKEDAKGGGNPRFPRFVPKVEKK
jgi:hypothetical protein